MLSILTSRAQRPPVSEHHRLDIQGLRAVAVLMVMVFHAGLPTPGGFVGVDVFFVISGFVITGMLDREHAATGRVRLRRFYLRRFKRLAPALAFVVALTVILSFCLLSPLKVQDVAAETGIGAILLVANFVIALTTGDYFLIRADSNPLVHTWSLSVEEQFYLLYPAILVLCWILSRRAKRRLPWAQIVIGALAVVSFSLTLLPSDIVKTHADSFGYYSPLPRAFEFGAGALLALTLKNRSLPSTRVARVCAWLGITFLLGSLWLIDKNTHFPGPWTLLPVGGTVLLIAAGTRHDTFVTRALSRPAMVTLGDWSYSLYLWHWPLRVFAVHLFPDISFASALATAVSVIPAAASYRWIEQPIRRMTHLSRPRTAALIAAVVVPSLLVAVLGVIGAKDYWQPLYRSGAIGLVHPGDSDFLDHFRYLDRTYFPCADQAIRDDSFNWEGITRCRQSKPGAHVDVVIVGDSHGEHLFLGLAEAAPDVNIAYYVVTTLPVRSDARTNRIIDHVAADPGIKTVIVNANWPLRGVPRDDLATTFRAFTSAGKSVFVTDDIPLFPFDAEACKYRIAPTLPFTICSMERRRFQKAYDKYFPVLRAAVRQVPRVQLLTTAEFFCETSTCSMTKGETLYYRDLNHVNDIGSRYVARRMISEFPQFAAALKPS